MMEEFLARAAEAYAFTYFGALLVLALVEWVLPRRTPAGAMGPRWMGNVGLGVVDAIVVRLLFPAVGLAWAAVCASRGWGLFNEIAIPAWAGIAVSFAALDFTAYAQHWLLHRVPLLWRMHLTHHTDHDVDFTTGLRFHPFEAVYTTVARMAAIAALGLPPLGVFVAEVAGVIIGFWEHSNTRVPPTLERAMRWIIITPAVHRTHHSMDARDHGTNFGNIFNFWDRAFGTYRDRPAAGTDEAAATGVEGYADPKHAKLPWLLAQPFVHGAGPAPEATPASSRATRTPHPADPFRSEPSHHPALPSDR